MSVFFKSKSPFLAKRLVFAMLLATCLFCFHCLTPVCGQEPSEFEFFPWESCLLLNIEKMEQSGKDQIFYATIEDVLRGNFSKRNPISVYVSRGDSRAGSPANARFEVGKTVLVAFNSLPANRFRKHLKIYNEYFPLSEKDQNQVEIEKLKGRLANSNFPFRAVVDVTITKNKFVKKGCEACHPGRIDIEAVVNQVYLPDRLSKAEASNALNEKTVPKTFHANLQKGQKLEAFFYEDFARPIKKGERYIWKFNPVYHDQKDPARIFLGLNGGTFSIAKDLTENQTKELNLLSERFEQYLDAVHARMQKAIEKTWTKDQVQIYTLMSELRYIPRTQGVVVTEGNVMSGQLFGSEEAKLGKVLWFSGLQDGKPSGEYQLQVHKQGSEFWVLDSGYFSNISQMSQNRFWQKYFKDLLTKCGITYVRVNNLKDSKELSLTNDEIVLELDSEKNINAISCRLQNEKTLTAKVDANLNLSQFEIDGAYSSVWQNAYDERVENMNKVWQETLRYEKW